ncbi:MAG: DNA internalization-related competence protein ComEC/Rec2 [Chloroflexi bacterium]|nr:DNA internalization-related competence protein ComEC/Rec2 [Chloroflexota bacterium]
MTSTYLTAGWLAGIFLGSLSEFPLFVLAAFAVATLAALWHWRKCSMLTAILCLALLLLAVIRYDAAVSAQDKSTLSPYSGKDQVALRGYIAAEPELRDRYTVLVLAVTDVSLGNGWNDASGKILVQIPRFPERAYGDRLELRGRLEQPQNFGDFDYKSHLARNGIYFQMRFPRVATYGPSTASDPLAAIRSLKRDIARRLDQSLPEPQASLSKGILLGIRTAMPQELLAAFARTNTTHILAISGWNITLVAGFLRLLGRRVLGRGALTIFVLLGLLLYTMLIGPQPSVLRAALMGSTLLIGEYFGRPGDIVVGLLLAAAAMTAVDPLYLWDISFQLSFASTAGIALLAPRLQGHLRFLPSWLSDSIAVTLAAQLSTLPITSITFGQLSTVTIVANLLVLPALLPIMITTALTALLTFFWTPLAQVIGLFAWVFLTYMIRAVEYLASVPWASLSIVSFAPVLALPYYALVATLFARKDVHAPDAHVTRLPSLSLATTVMFGTLATGGIIAWSAFFSIPDDDLRISFLDVGQGDAVLIETSQGQRILIDGGPSPTKLMDALGRRMPFWDRTIDLVVLSHPNDDHLAGLIDVLERLEVRQIMEPSIASSVQSANYRRWREIIAARSVPRVEAMAGQEIDLNDGTIITVLHPFANAEPARSANESSIVLKLVSGNVSALFTGDIDSKSQHLIAGSRIDLTTTLLKVPHHGARDSLDGAFLDAVKPSLAVISVGKDNQFGHPAPDTLAQLRNAQVLRTDLDGTVELTIGRGEYAVKLMP